jgi:hypothetical protein
MNPEASNMYYHYCDKNIHNTADCRSIAKFKQQKKGCFEAKSGPGKKSLAFLFEEIYKLKWRSKPEKTASDKKRNSELLLFTEINLANSSDEGDKQEYFQTFS